MSDPRRLPRQLAPFARTLVAFGSAVLIAPTTTAGDLTDPTRPPGAAVGAAPTDAPADAGNAALDLSAVLYAAGRRIAIIDGRRVHEGDAVGDAHVVEIGPDRVRLSRADEELVLDLAHRPVKQPHRPDERRAAWIGPSPPAVPAAPAAPSATDRDADGAVVVQPTHADGAGVARKTDASARADADARPAKVERGRTE